jgi:hypothetical protein
VPGQEAGLAHFDGGRHHAAFGVHCDDGGEFFLRFNFRVPEQAVSIRGPVIRLRSTVAADRFARFDFSTDDGITWTAWPDTYALRSGGHRGDRIGLYTFNNRTPSGGYADFDYFRYEFDHQP